ncbi:MAG TPA: FAD-dependent oxidoreductase [Prolixibacteraceae bacterium]|nr:FAD-dependent oxidoreductase [Prolixibacteraceae bacterium]
MKEISSSEFEQEVLNGGKVVLDFYSTECPPCEAVAPKFESLAKMYGHEIKFVKMYRQQNRELSDKLGVKSSPTLLFYDQGKEVTERLAGGIKRSEIIKNLNAMLPVEVVKEITGKIKPQVSEFDVIVLGGGPGGLTAGLYLCQAKINTVLVDISLPGGHVSTTHEVSNYPGFIDPQAGYMLSHNMSEQTKLCGTVFKVAVDVTRVDLVNRTVVIDEMETIHAKKIIIATGTTPNLTGAKGERELKGRGISYCATCDAKYFVDKEVIVIGGGNSAVEESDFISKFASKVTIIHQFAAFTANKTAQDKLLANPKVHPIFLHEPRSFQKVGDRMVVEVEDLTNREIKTIEGDGVFIFIGMKPNLGLFKDKLELDQWGYIKTDDEMRTSIPNVYAVGDVISKKYRQITTAVADGTIAAISIAKELD